MAPAPPHPVPGAEPADPVVGQFRHLWQNGPRPDLHDFLGRAGPVTPERLLAVLEIDQHHRWRLGERPRVESYLAAFPALNGDHRTFSLVRAEMHLGWAGGEPVDLEDYRRRFPHFVAELAGVGPAQGNGTNPDLHPETSSIAPTQTSESGFDKAHTVVLRPGWVPADALPEDTPPPQAAIPPSRVERTAGSAEVRVQQIGPYEIERVLSHGGMGIIYQAIDTRLKRRVALKMILSGAHADPATLARFRGEAEAVAQLQHANIVQIYEVGEHDGLPYLALEFVEGKNLQQLAAEEQMSPREAAALVRTLARAVEFAHQRGIIHRDLKPGNILLTPQGVPKITDFGLAKLKGAHDTHTRPGEVIGTPNYMAPEQADGNPDLVGPATDVYSLGAVLYELLTGQPPFHGASPMETLLRLRLNNPIRPRYFQPNLPLDLEKVCLKCLEKERHARYARSEQLAEDLQRFIDGRPVEARQSGPAERLWKWWRRHPAISLLGMALLTCVLFSYVSFLVQWRDVQRMREELRRQTRELTGMKAGLDEQRKAAADAQQAADRARRRADWARNLSRLNEAEREYLTRDAAKAQDLLNQCDPEFRSWAWNYLRRQVEGSAVTVAMPPRELLALVVTPDEQATASVTQGARLLKRRLATGEELSNLKLGWDDAHAVERLANRAVFAPDAALLAAVCVITPNAGGPSEQRVGVWETSSGRLVHSWPAPPGTLLRLTFRPDGKRLVMLTGVWNEKRGHGGWDGGAAAVLDIESGAVAWRRPTPPDSPSFTDATFMPDSPRLAFTRRDAALVFLDAGDGHALGEVDSPGFEGQGLCVNSRGTLLAVHDGSSVHLFDAQGKPAGQLAGHAGNVTLAAFSDDGRTIFTASDDHTVRGWELQGRKQTHALVGHTQPVHLLALGRSGRSAVTFGLDGKFKVWTLGEDGPPSLDTGAGREWTPGAAFGPGGKWLVSASGDGQIALWDMATGERLKTHHQAVGILCLALSPDAKTLAIGTDKPSELVLLDPQTGATRRVIQPGQAVNAVSFSPDGSRLLVACDRGLAAVYQTDSGQRISTFSGHHGSITGAFSPRGDLIATGGADGWIQLWDPATGEARRGIFAHATAVSAVAFSPDGARLASGNQTREHEDVPGLIRIWEVASGDLITELKGHDRSVWCLAFTPDGNRLASGGEDKTVKIWELSEGQLLVTLKGHTDDVRCVTFSPDGHVLVSSNDDNLIRFWDATPLDRGPGVQAHFLLNDKVADGDKTTR